MTVHKMFAALAILGIAGSAMGQNSIDAGPYPASVYQWRIDTDPGTAGNQIARRVTGALNSTFQVDIKMNITGADLVREMFYEIHFDNRYLQFVSFQCLPNGPAPFACANCSAPATCGTA